jgi:cytochrome b561/polyisoprenoid-binding protein YceI
MSDVASNPRAAGGGRYSAGAIILHWLIAALIVVQVLLAWRMDGPHTPQSFAITQLHKSDGVLILLLSLARVAWRLTNPPPPMPKTMAAWERFLAGATHLGFYAIMLGMPLTGWMMVSSSRTHIPTVLYGTIPWPDLPGGHGAAQRLMHVVGTQGHQLLAYGLYVLLALHVAGALKHQLFSQDEPVLARMAPGAVAGRWLDPRLIAIGVVGLAIVAFGWFFQPPVPQMTSSPPPSAAETASAPEPAPAPAQSAPAAPSAPQTAAAVAPAPAGAVKWTVLTGSSVTWSTTWSGSAISGRFDKWTADVVFGPDALDKSKVTVAIDVASVNSGDAQRDQSLPAPDWFDAGAHPKAIFTATKFEKTGADRFVAHGSLELRGVKKPVDLPFTLHIDGDRARVSGVTSLDRTAFGVGQGEWSSTDQIPAKVAVKVSLAAKRQSPAP